MKKSVLSFILLTNMLVASLQAELTRDNGVVSDSITSLQWQDDYTDNSNTIKRATWSEALNYCEALSLGGFSDWRLPNKNELLSLIDYSKYSPAIKGTAFLNISSAYYWSSTSRASNTNFAWNVNFHNGNAYDDYKTGSYSVRCVRAGQ